MADTIPRMATIKNSKKVTKRTPAKAKGSPRLAVASPVAANTGQSLITSSVSRINNLPFAVKLIIIVLIGVSIFWLVRKYRGSIIAGVVNKTPILRYELNQKLVARYGTTTMDEMVSEELLSQLARREQVTVTAEEIQAERDALKERLGGDESLQTALQQYGLSEADLSKQIELKLYTQKLSEKLFQVEVSDEEARAIFDDNIQLYEGKTFDDVKTDIKESLRQQKLQQEFGQWFEEQKSQSQIQVYL